MGRRSRRMTRRSERMEPRGRSFDPFDRPGETAGPGRAATSAAGDDEVAQEKDWAAGPPSGR
eukprot:1962398-Pyramimonas_sp.AAC.1